MRCGLRSFCVKFHQLLRLASTHGGSFATRRFVVVLLLVLIASALFPLGPVALKLIVDGFTGHATTHSLTTGFAIALYIVSVWLARSIYEVTKFNYARAERRTFTGISARFFEHVLQLPFGVYIQRATGGINQTRENGLLGFQLIFHNLMLLALPVTVQLVTTAWILFRIHQPTVLLILSATIVCYATTFGYFVVRVMSAAEDASAAQIDASSQMSDFVANYETIKFFTAESIVCGSVHERLSFTEERWISFYRTYAAIGLIAATIFAACLASVITFAAHEVSAGRITVGEFVLINTLMLQLIQPIELLGYAVQDISQGVALCEKMLTLLREETEEETLGYLMNRRAVREIVPRSPSDEAPAALKFWAVSVSYSPDRPALKDVNFTVAKGRTLGIVGASGSGKSTLVRLLMRLLEPTEGAILIDGVAASELSLATVRQAIAVVPQDTLLFNGSIGYNIGFGKTGCSQEEIERAAKLAHLHDFIRSLPEGYRTPVGERGVKLSGGERQRLSIARAALKEPSIYVFDEATSSLDGTTERQIMENLREISRLRTTLIIAHRLSTVAHADEIIVLDGGTIAERGTHADLLRHQGKYSALWTV